MIYAVYNFLLLVLTAFFWPVACVMLIWQRKYRAGFFEKSTITMKPLHLPLRPLWIHAVSVGEVMAAAPLIREIRRRKPGLPIVVSTVTETGNLTAQRNLKDVDRVLFFPYDYPSIVRRSIRHVNPCAFVSLETEIWPNFLRELAHQNIPAMIISGRISEQSFKNYYYCRFFFRHVLAYLSWCCMQTEEDAYRIISIGANPDRVIVTGNIKFDLQIPPIGVQEYEKLMAELHIREGQPVVIAGSTHRGEEEILVEVFRAVKQRFPDALLILAPRHPERFEEVAAMLRTRGLEWQKRTLLSESCNRGSCDIILLDTIGELAKIYSLGTVIFIGGSLVPVGGHNVLEPGVFKKPVLFGPFMDNFSEIAKMLISRNGACQVFGQDDCISHMIKLLEDPELRSRIGNAAFRVIEENSGAVARSLDVLEKLMKKQPNQ